MGTSLRITCSMSCDKGVARVHWRGLDTSLGSVQTHPGSSILSVRGMLSDTGTPVCVGSCGSRSFQHSVKILVYGEAHSAFLGATCPREIRTLHHTNAIIHQVPTLACLPHTVDLQGCHPLPFLSQPHKAVVAALSLQTPLWPRRDPPSSALGSTINPQPFQTNWWCPRSSLYLDRTR